MSIENDIHVIKELIRELVDLQKGKPFKTIDTLIHDAKKEKTKTKAKVVSKTETVQVELKPLTADDVKMEARKLVDGFKTNRKGFEKAKKILDKLGTTRLENLVPEKYAEAINEFRKAVKLFGG